MNIDITIRIEDDRAFASTGGTKNEKVVTVEREYASGTLDRLEEEAARTAQLAVTRWTA
jgi:hypothetical protein